MIGDDVLVASQVLITDLNHGRYSGTEAPHSPPSVAPAVRPNVSEPVEIGSRAWIGEGVTVLPGSVIGEGAIIAAHAVVNSVIPPAVIAAGQPARVVKMWNPSVGMWERVRKDSPIHQQA